MRTVHVYKWDQTLHYEWESRVIEEHDQYVLLYNGPGRTLRHHTRGQTFTYDTHALECFLPQEGFTAQLDLETDGSIRFYCNVGLPPVITATSIHFTDLDIDVVYDEQGWRRVDLDEFETNRVRYAYPESVVHHVDTTLEALERRISEQRFPFDGSLEAMLRTLAQSPR